jgi:hypothetical protein
VTATKHGGCRQLTASGGIESGRVAPAVLGRAASRVVRPGRGAIFLGRRQQREDQVLPYNLAAATRYAAQAEEIITSPPERDPYTTLRTELVR